MFKLSVSKKTIVSFTRINSVIIAGLFRPEQNYQWSFSETLFYLRMKNWNSNHLIIWIFESLTRQCQIYELINLKNTKNVSGIYEANQIRLQNDAELVEQSLHLLRRRTFWLKRVGGHASTNNNNNNNKFLFANCK